jgi:sugar phosphate isomerase/epimerase
MRIGLLTAAFPGLTLEEVADWSAANGFRALEVACWPREEGAARRYAGVTHIDVETLDDVTAREVLDMLAARGLVISALAYYPNHLDPDPERRHRANDHLRRVIVAAERLGVDIVGTFLGRDQTRDVPANLAAFREVWPPLVRFAAEHGIRVAIENCPMIFSYDEWPGGTNLAYSPAIWREMFVAVPDENFGLNLDPSHLVWQMIDYERVVRDFAPRIFHVHAKDMEIDRDGLYEHGVMSTGIGWQRPRLPGLGEVRWDRFIAALYRVGYDHVISVEHEDRAFEGTEERVQRGFLIARDALAPYIV